MKEVQSVARWSGATMLVVALGCQVDPRLPAELDEAFFRCRVLPVLDARCSMLECHGDARRPLRIYTRNRLRLDADPVQLDLPITDEELELDYDGAAAFAEGGPDRALLLKKPLDEAVGGYFHQGRELYQGGDVFASEDDPGYETIVSWMLGEDEDPACIHPGQAAGAEGDGQ